MARTSRKAGEDRQDIYTEVTERIIREVEGGVIPWVRPWKDGVGQDGLPVNAASGRRYSGINLLLLWMSASGHGYSTSRWLTYRQAAEVGGQVRRGERGTMVVYAATYTPRDEVERSNESGEEPRSIPFLKRFVVFNVDQIDGLSDRMRHGEQVADAPGIARNGDLDRFVAATGADMRFGGSEAYYSRSGDYIQMPPPEAFGSAQDLFTVQAHELAHWAGAAHRLNREFGARFGDTAYMREELVAEIAAAQLSAVMGVPPVLRHAAYVQHWLSLLREDRHAIFNAARHASAAVDFLLNRARANEGAGCVQPDMPVAA